MIVALNRARGEDRREPGASREPSGNAEGERLRKCGAQQVSRIASVTAFLKTRCHSRRWEFIRTICPRLPPRVFAKSRPIRRMVG